MENGQSVKLVSSGLCEFDSHRHHKNMKLKKCEKHKSTFMVSSEMLLIVLAALLSDPEIWIYKIERCDIGGWHIYSKKAP